MAEHHEFKFRDIVIAYMLDDRSYAVIDQVTVYKAKPSFTFFGLPVKDDGISLAYILEIDIQLHMLLLFIGIPQTG
jgi:hypothetical protein